MNRAFLVLSGLLVPGWVQAATPCAAANIRWSATSNRLYVSGDVRCTLTQIRDLATTGVPLTLVDATHHVWLLGSDLVLEGGATLALDGSAIGGDVDELRLLSNNSYAGTARVEICAQWGNLLIRSTRVTSWDEDAGGPDTEYETYGRAFIRVLSYLEGDTARQSRMDVSDSDIGYLGYYAAESYGLVWKVRGVSAGIYDQVDVLGDVTNSTIHDNYFGMYTFGAYGMHIAGNEFYDNIQYGVDPHDDSDALVIEDNNIHDNGNHGFICSQRCDGLEIRNNVSSSNAQTGYMLHRSVVDTIVENNLAEFNADAGFAIVDSHQNILRNNVARHNKYGVRLSVGATENIIADNEVTDSTLYGIYMYQGTDLGSINDGRPAQNTFSGNELWRNGMGVRASDAYANRFMGNVFGENGTQAAFLFNSDANVFSANDLGGSYIYLQGLSTNGVEDTDFAQVQIGGDAAAMVFTDSSGRVYDNGAGLATVVDAEGSTLTLTRADDTGIVAVTAVDLTVVPSGGAVELAVVGWQVSSRSWTTTPSSAATARFTVGGLSPGSSYTLWIDGRWSDVLIADSHGAVRFSADVKAAHAFSVKSIVRTSRPGSITWSSR